jgi:hypothetical protein
VLFAVLCRDLPGPVAPSHATILVRIWCLSTLWTWTHACEYMASCTRAWTAPCPLPPAFVPTVRNTRQLTSNGSVCACSSQLQRATVVAITRGCRRWSTMSQAWALMQCGLARSPARSVNAIFYPHPAASHRASQHLMCDLPHCLPCHVPHALQTSGADWLNIDG